jgi:hypothetical protein
MKSVTRKNENKTFKNIFDIQRNVINYNIQTMCHCAISIFHQDLIISSLKITNSFQI